MKNDTKRTVVGIGLKRMRVGYLNDGKKGKQDEAQNGCGDQSTRPTELASSWLKDMQE